MPTLDQIRAKGEQRIERALEKLDSRHRALVAAAILQYGSVDAIPQQFWDELQRDTENDTAAILLLLMLSGHEWTAQELKMQGVVDADVAADQSAYALAAARQAQTTAEETLTTVRDRLARKVQDAALTGPGSIGEMTPAGVEVAVNDVFSQARRLTIATDSTTQSLTRGQLGAAEQIGGDGASLVTGQKVTLQMIWHTERDNLVCPRCLPLEGQPEEVWSLVFPEGPGPEAHPNCRCFLEPRVLVVGATE